LRGRPEPQYPALSADGDTLRVTCAQVTFCSRYTGGTPDAAWRSSGTPAPVDQRLGGVGRTGPLRGLKVGCSGTDLLDGLLAGSPYADSQDCLVPLTLFLPVGCTYQSTLGRFRIDEQGTVHALTDGMVLEGNVLCRDAPAPPQPEPPQVVRGYWVMSHAMRRVFRRGETAHFHVIASGHCPAAQLDIVAGTHVVGRLPMPAIDGTDTRDFVLGTGALPPGPHTIAVRHNAHFEIQLVDVLDTSPTYVHAVSCCNMADFTVDDAGPEALTAAGVRSVAAFGRWALLNDAGHTAARDAPPRRAAGDVATP
jgi:hypothetical protein